MTTLSNIRLLFILTSMLVAYGCSETDGGNADSGGGGNTDSGGGGDGGMLGGGGGGGSTSSGMTGSCNSAPWTDDASCQDCLEQSCCFALNACEPGSDCIALKDCVDSCASDIACALACIDAHETGVVAIEALAQCDGDSCQGCGSLPQTDFSCAPILQAYQDTPFAMCAEEKCCDEVVACDADQSCDLVSALYGDCAPGVLCNCIADQC